MATDILVTKAGEEPGAKSLRVEVPVERVRDAEAKATALYAKQARLPGFRPGKAPVAVVRKRFHDAIRESAIRDLIQESWKTALEQETLKPVADPHVHHLKFEDGAPVTFEFHVEVRPELALGRLSGFKLTRTVTPVTDDQVEKQLTELRKQKGPWAAVEGRSPVAGELAQISLATIEDGVAGEGKPYHLVLGEGRALPMVEERLMTMISGQTLDAEIRFPEDYPDEARRGQLRHVRITLHDVKHQELPAMDDAFAREVGDFESLADLQKALRTDLETEAGREADAEVRRQLIEQIAEANSVVAPRPMVERFLAAYAQGYGVQEAEFDKFAAEFRPIAEAQVRRDLILDHVEESAGLKATEAEIDTRVQDLAARRKMEPGQLYASLQKANRLRELERTITEEKVFSHLLAQSTVTET
ncbi:MAG TPA: trigger factor [Gemmatimonadales bacterium]|jgi:trigger factor